MKVRIWLPSLLLLLIPSLTPAQYFAWEDRLASGQTSSFEPLRLQADAEGNVFSAWRTTGGSVIAKFSSSGAMLWRTQLLAPARDFALVGEDIYLACVAPSAGSWTLYRLHQVHGQVVHKKTFAGTLYGIEATTPGRLAVWDRPPAGSSRLQLFAAPNLTTLASSAGPGPGSSNVEFQHWQGRLFLSYEKQEVWQDEFGIHFVWVSRTATHSATSAQLAWDQPIRAPVGFKTDRLISVSGTRIAQHSTATGQLISEAFHDKTFIDASPFADGLATASGMNSPLSIVRWNGNVELEWRREVNATQCRSITLLPDGGVWMLLLVDELWHIVRFTAEGNRLEDLPIYDAATASSTHLERLGDRWFLLDLFVNPGVYRPALAEYSSPYSFKWRRWVECDLRSSGSALNGIADEDGNVYYLVGGDEGWSVRKLTKDGEPVWSSLIHNRADLTSAPKLTLTTGGGLGYAVRTGEVPSEVLVGVINAETGGLWKKQPEPPPAAEFNVLPVETGGLLWVGNHIEHFDTSGVATYVESNVQTRQLAATESGRVFRAIGSSILKLAVAPLSFQQWRQFSGEDLSGALATHEERVLFLSNVGDQVRLRFIDTSNGAELWVRDYPAADFSGFANYEQAVIGTECAYLFSTTGGLQVQALELADGSLGWRRALPQFTGATATDDGNLLLTTDAGLLMLHDRQTGQSLSTLQAVSAGVPIAAVALVSNKEGRILMMGSQPWEGALRSLVQCYLYPRRDISSELSALSVHPASVQSGSTATGTVKLSQPAPLGGALVTLTSGSAVIDVPPLVKVAEGQVLAHFTIKTSAVASQTERSIQARLGTSAKSAAILLLPTPTVSRITFFPGSATGGTKAIMTLHLTIPAAPSGTSVTLNSSSSAVSVPASVNVPAGSTTASLPVSTNPVATVTFANVTATTAGISTSAVLIVRPPALISLEAPDTMSSGFTAMATVYLSGAAPSGYVLSVSSNSSVLHVPSSVTVPQGATSVTFPITAGTATSPVLRHITVRKGSMAKTEAITITP